MDDQDTYPFIVVCQKNCSGHGHCDMKTKRCICEAFWTSNLFLYWIYGETNCGGAPYFPFHAQMQLQNSIGCTLKSLTIL
ncbi:hypothetical protein DPMN_102580 [Dreissena polymorpha]|uniref:Uncharacterized protein n=1 Tax=Dreissena polymorpha TaxID=45954 RepID=A0A9D4RAN4_DREPO|nr:hypothetical protein DPMN_102580 [Dreissena polymorpha]